MKVLRPRFPDLIRALVVLIVVSNFIVGPGMVQASTRVETPPAPLKFQEVAAEGGSVSPSAVQMALDPSGTLTGTVTAAGSGAPLSNINIRATRLVTEVYDTVSNGSGIYSLALPVGSYTVTASSYGYVTGQSVVSVVSGTTATVNFSLAAVPSYVVSGTVSDATAGWPLYASVVVTGYPVAPPAPANRVWTNPATGFYSLTLAEGSVYTLTMTTWSGGYDGVVRPLTVTGSQTQNFIANPDMVSCRAPGYKIIGGLAETFDRAVVPALPLGWAVTVVTPTSPIARWDTRTTSTNPTATPHSAPNMAGFNSYNALAGAGARLYTTSGLDMTGLTSWMLSFWMYHDSGLSARNDQVQVQVSTDGGSTWINVGSPVARYSATTGWANHTVDLFLYHTQPNVRIGFLGISAYGNNIILDDISIGSPVCSLTSGGMLFGNVYDANYPTQILSGAIVTAAGTISATVTTADPANDDSFYLMFVPAGAQPMTATVTGAYGPKVLTPTVVAGTSMKQDFFLPAGKLSVTPAVYALTLPMGQNHAGVITFTNSGGLAASLELSEINAAVNSQPAGTLADIPWLSAVPVTMTVAAGGYRTVSLNISAAELNAGVYSARLAGFNNTPYGDLLVPVVLTVTIPPSWGAISGTVKLLGHCDLNPLPVNGLPVLLQSESGFSVTLYTGVDGRYSFPLDPAGTPYRVSVAMDGYEPQVLSGIVIASQVTTTANINLRRLEPCGTVNPERVDAALLANQSETQVISLTNSGMVSSGISIDFAPAAPWLAVSPTTFDLEAGEVQPISLTFTALPTFTPGMTNSTVLHIQSTDPVSPELLVPITFRVDGPPACAFNSNSPTDFGTATVFTFTGTGTQPITYLWNFGDSFTGTLAHPTHTYARMGTYTVTLDVSNTLGADACTQTVAIEGRPAVSFTVPGSWKMGIPVTFTNASYAYPAITGYEWNFGDPAGGVTNTSTLENPTHTYATAGIYTVVLTATNGRGALSYTRTVLIQANYYMLYLPVVQRKS